MLRRKAMDDLFEWKSNSKRKALLISGARQVGKTYLVNEFGKSYKSFVSFDFLENDSYRNIFKDDRSVDAITEKMSLYKKDAQFIPGETLIFLDEIQDCPDARTSLKFFTQDGRYDVIASGSLLGVKYKEVRSNPVGNIDRMTLHSLDFEEFLWALGMSESIIAHVKGALKEKKKIGSPYYEEIDRLFRIYMIVGGMPEVVSEYLSSRNFGNVLRLQRNIVSDYNDDIAKYAEGTDRNRAKACLRSIPGQLARRNKKFKFTDVEDDTNARITMYSGSLSWLQDAGIVSICYNVDEPVSPLALSERYNYFKVYMNDTGLLMSMMNADESIVLMEGDHFVNEGAIAENIVAEMLVKNGVELTYFEKIGNLKVDFIAEIGGTVTAIEVKSGNTKRSASLKKAMGDVYKVKKGMKLRNGDVDVVDDGLVCYPLFAMAFIKDL